MNLRVPPRARQASIRTAVALIVAFSAIELLACSVAAPEAVRLDAALTHRVSARESGAKGDGQADDTSALQRALAGGRRTVVIEAGTYSIRAALKVDSETIVRADPHAIIRLAAGAGNSV